MLCLTALLLFPLFMGLCLPFAWTSPYVYEYPPHYYHCQAGHCPRDGRVPVQPAAGTAVKP